jgi:hypothetical protein
MSSYGNHVYTPDREATARKLVELAADCDDDGFAETLHGLDMPNLLAITALLIERLADLTASDDDA